MLLGEAVRMTGFVFIFMLTFFGNDDNDYRDMGPPLKKNVGVGGAMKAFIYDTYQQSPHNLACRQSRLADCYWAICFGSHNTTGRGDQVHRT